jgi:phenylalanyl-tRNA synthetase beta chain
MLVPLSWLQSVLPPLTATGRQVADALIRVGLEVERVEAIGIEPLVVGEIREIAEEPQKNGKTIRWCQVEVGEPEIRGIVCGASNFAVGDLVVVALPGAVLPGGFTIAARKTYGHVSDGMICSARELGIGDAHDGIIVLAPEPGVEPGTDAAVLLDLVDEILDIAVTPDRGYTMSLRGVAREVAIALELPFADPGARVLPGGLGYGVEVELADPVGCDHYVALTIQDLDPAATTPAWMRRRLERGGMRSISLAVDVTNYVMLELGQPLHAFDADRLTSGITVRSAQPGEIIRTLDGVDRKLDPADLVITDSEGPVALAGVMGGERTEINANTRRILIESAHFAPTRIALSARRHRLPSEASRRYERGVDPALCIAAAAAAAALLSELGGSRATAYTDVDLRPQLPDITLRAAYPGEVGGHPIPLGIVCRRLEEVGANISGKDPIIVVPPPWRPDLREPIDLVEEVLRLEGFDRLPIRLPRAPAGRGFTPRQRQRRGISRALATAGYVEVQTSPFMGPDPLGLPDGDPRREALRLRNPLSAEEAYLRTTLLPGLLAALGRNVSRGRRDVALFETGTVFRARDDAAFLAPPPAAVRPSPEVLAALDASLPAQPERAAVVIAGLAEPAGWWGAGRPAEWSDVVGAASAAAAAVQLELTVEAADEAPWHPGRCARLKVNGQTAGYAGELHPALLERLELPPRTCAGEVWLDVLASAGELVQVAPLSTYPPGIVDVALVVPDAVASSAVTAALRAGAGELLESLTLFDLYRGAPIPAGSRSLAYTLTFRAPDRTLSGDEVNALRDSAVAAAVAVGAVLRA